MRDSPGPAGFSNMKTAEMRAAFLIEDLFIPGEIRMVCWNIDRAVIGAAVPGSKTISLPSCKELAAEYFTQRRELGVVNIGGPGLVRVSGQEFSLAKKEALYIGKENREIRFSSSDFRSPAQFYFVSYPAHAVHPCAKVGRAQAKSAELGNAAAANKRTIYRLINPEGVASCQLTMGFTELAPGSVWNTMPPHTHTRRSEIYLYLDLPEDALVVHCMGLPQETRNLMVRDRQVVVSPSWSMHFGVGTTNYSFVWAMGGENQEFSDMDVVPINTLL
jgi:4-deoxy-L-threo-5-hexosulose-uronate ketol-isomerase